MRRSREHLNGLGPRMKRRYMPEMTNLQVREYMEGGGRTVLVPVGSTEDHGDHGPLWTDVYIPLEVCKRAARGARRARRAPGPVRPRARPPRSQRDRLRPARDVRLDCSATSASRSPRPASSGSRCVNGHYVNSYGDAVRGRARSSTSCRRACASTRSRTGRDSARRRPSSTCPGAPACTRTSARPRRCSRSTPTSATWSASATSCRSSRVCERARSRCSTRSSCRRPARSGRSSRRAAASGAIRASRPSRRASSSSAGARRAVVNLVRDMEDDARPDRAGATTASARPAVITLAILGGGFMARRRTRANYARARRSGAREDDRSARRSDAGRRGRGVGRRGADRRPRRGDRRPGGRRGRHLPADAAPPRGGRACASPPASTSSSRSRSR